MYIVYTKPIIKDNNFLTLCWMYLDPMEQEIRQN